MDTSYNKYNLQEQFPLLSSCLEKLCYHGNNSGQIYYLNFCGDGESSTFDYVYSGGKSFANSDYKLFFTPTNYNVSGSLILNVLFVVPAYLEVMNGNLAEFYP